MHTHAGQGTRGVCGEQLLGKDLGCRELLDRPRELPGIRAVHARVFYCEGFRYEVFYCEKFCFAGFLL